MTTINLQLQSRRIRLATGPVKAERDVCTICQGRIRSSDPTFTHDTCNQSWHRSPCFEDLWLHVTSHQEPPYRCSYCHAILAEPYPCHVNIAIVHDENDLSCLKVSVGEGTFNAKSLGDRKIKTVSTEEFLSRIIRPDNPETCEHLSEVCFMVSSWALYKFPEASPNIHVWAIPDRVHADYQTLFHEMVEWRRKCKAQGEDGAPRRADSPVSVRPKSKLRRLLGDIKGGLEYMRMAQAARRAGQ